MKGLTAPRGVLKPLLKNHLKLAPENDLRSEDQGPAFVERRLELIGEVHGCLESTGEQRALQQHFKCIVPRLFREPVGGAIARLSPGA